MPKANRPTVRLFELPLDEWPEDLTPGEVASLFRVDPKTVHRWATEGRIAAWRTPGNHRRFDREVVWNEWKRGQE